MPLNNTFLFVHLPKTAGTSFRLSAAEYFGNEACHFDYGSGNPETSPAIEQTVYKHNDLFRLEKQLHRLGSRFFCGHVLAKRYTPLFSAHRLVTFIRSPLDQFVSHFEHKVRHHDYKGDIGELINSPSGPDLQSRMMHGIPLEAWGFIGVTERYAESLEVFNTIYQTALPALALNRNPSKVDAGYALPASLQQAFAARAKLDDANHQRAHQLLDERLRALKDGYDFVQGAVTSHAATHVSGFAFHRETSRPVKLELWVNNKLLSLVDATLYDPVMRSINAPRNGYVGFRFQLKTSLQPGDQVQLRVKNSGQLLKDWIFVE